ncbi:hypothetical protein SAMN04487772_1258 [[Clostridium] polysaccharolyticum]|uniref:Lipoprotein n=2 Tax=[Clostridium] polysaccharolyticum TaxID=29364 RepID=A0A1I0EUU2_9FIRM|nr:hypothetical protein SAMN04487772_1258 [[Clostridium] polysaccharolyticum]
MGLCICLMLSVTGCKGRLEALRLADVKSETILLRSDGSVQSGAYESFNEIYYDQAELKKFMKKQIEDFNREQGEECVKLEKFKIEKRDSKHIAKAVVTFDNVKRYGLMNQSEIAEYTMKEAKEAGVLPEVFTVASDGSRVNQNKVTENADYKVLVMKMKGKVIFPDTVKYYKDVMLLSPNTVETTEEERAVIVYK